VGNPSGSGAVYGMIGLDVNDLPYDCGMVEHPYPLTTVPTTGSDITSLYWPRYEYDYDGSLNTLLELNFTGVKYVCPTGGSYYYNPGGPDGTGFNSLTSGCSGYTFTGLGYQAPIGRFSHHEFIGSSGYRLLPNYAVPNNTNTNTYTPTTGGSLPALSMDNGMAVYLDISWSAGCGGASGCVDAP
jgi:hypothetical protein